MINENKINLSTPFFHSVTNMLLQFEIETSDDAEELFDPHVDVDPAEELVHVASPLLQDGGGSLDAGSTSMTVAVRLAGKHFAEPAQHQLQPLITWNKRQEIRT